MKSNKIVFRRDVHCCDEYCDNRPDSATVSISLILAARIIELSKAAAALNVYKIVEFDYTPGWKESGVKKPDWSIDCVTLNVTNEDFFWNAFIKHTNISVEMKAIRISDLKKKLGEA